jgi:hypothetical protein
MIAFWCFFNPFSSCLLDFVVTVRHTTSSNTAIIFCCLTNMCSEFILIARANTELIMCCYLFLCLDFSEAMVKLDFFYIYLFLCLTLCCYKLFSIIGRATRASGSSHICTWSAFGWLLGGAWLAPSSHAKLGRYKTCRDSDVWLTELISTERVQ